MAAIDDKIATYAFTQTSTRSQDQIAELISDAAQIAGSAGPKVVVTGDMTGRFTSVVTNFVRRTLAEFSILLEPAQDDRVTVTFTVDDYLRTRQDLFYVIPLTPWGAPGHKSIREFSNYLRENL